MKHVKKISAKALCAIVVAIVVAVLAAVVSVYSVVTRNIIENQTLSSIKELAAHDRNTLSMFITFNWENLKRSAKRLNGDVAGITTKEEVNAFLDNEAALTTFDKVYLVNADGSYYTGTTFKESGSPSYTDFVKLFGENKNRILDYGKVASVGSDNMIIYGYRLDKLGGFDYKDGIFLYDEWRKNYVNVVDFSLNHPNWQGRSNSVRSVFYVEIAKLLKKKATGEFTVTPEECAVNLNNVLNVAIAYGRAHSNPHP